MKIMLAALLVSATALGGCGSDDPPSEAGAAAYDEDAAIEQAAEELGSESFEDVGDTSTCTQDCSGHDAGFEWAKENDVTDASECGGSSQSFIEGCETYTEALEERAYEYDGGYDGEYDSGY